LNKSDFAARLTRYQNSLMINICDVELVDTEIKHGSLTIKMSKNFWQERTINESDAESLLKECHIANLVGDKIISKAITMNLAKRNSIKLFSNIPFLMIFRFHQAQ
jgi:uncharacterized protein